MDKEIVIKPNYVFKDYFKIYLSIYFDKLSNKIISLFIVLIILFNLYNVSNNNIELADVFSGTFIFLLLYPFIILFIKYKQTKIILSNPKLKEAVFIKINSNGYEILGDSFHIKFNWKEINKIIEKDNCFLIYMAKNDIKIIRKADLKNNQYNELKELFNSIDMKKSLKS